jgi:hypothetical protein
MIASAATREPDSKWDPHLVFYVIPGINADHTVAKYGRLCRLNGPVIKPSGDISPWG